jgi:hypothetical protein
MADNSDILNQLSADQKEQAKDAPAPVAEPAPEKPAAAPKAKAVPAAEK